MCLSKSSGNQAGGHNGGVTAGQKYPPQDPPSLLGLGKDPYCSSRIARRGKYLGVISPRGYERITSMPQTVCEPDALRFRLHRIAQRLQAPECALRPLVATPPQATAVGARHVGVRNLSGRKSHFIFCTRDSFFRCAFSERKSGHLGFHNVNLSPAFIIKFDVFHRQPTYNWNSPRASMTSRFVASVRSRAISVPWRIVSRTYL